LRVRFELQRVEAEPPRRPAENEPADQEAQAANRRDDAQFADTRQRQQIEAAREQQNAEGEGNTRVADQSPLNLRRQDRHAEDRQSVNQLIKHTGVEDRQIFRGEPVFQAMRRKCAKGHTGKAEESSQHQKRSKHVQLQAKSFNGAWSV
jgi:hypothetical protein